MQDAVIILAAGKLSAKLTFLKNTFDIPSLISINSRYVLKYIIDFYQDSGVSEIYVAINMEDIPLVESELSFYNKGIHLIGIENSKSVNHTLFQALTFLNKNIKNIIVNTITTIPNILPVSSEVQVSKCIDNNTNYAVISQEGKSYLFTSKNDLEQHKGYPFTGIFSGIRENIISAAFPNINSNDLLDTIKVLSQLSAFELRYTDWYDIGHEINYGKTRQQLLVSRSFNHFNIEKNLGLIIKTSEHSEKLNDERNYIKILPEDLQIFYPRIFGEIEFAMEYYGYSNVSELMLYKNLDTLIWERLFERFQYVLDKFASYRCEFSIDDYNIFHIDKFWNRLMKYSPQLIKESFIINELECKPLESFRDKINVKFEDLYVKTKFSIVHGDFCFNNILYDPTNDIIKFIDPRGSFGTYKGIMGDHMYDVAKLAHSSVGNYDFIVNDLFSYTEDGSIISYSFHHRKNKQILSSLTEELIVKLGYDVKDIYFLMSTLFLSMISLHNDAPQRQKIMFAHGVYLLNKFI